MRIRVMKFGGTSLLRTAQRQRAIALVRAALREGCTPVLVVSAFGRRGDPYATATLLEMVPRTNSALPAREVALLASCGEVIAASVLASALQHAAIPAVALTGAQAGIRTTGGYVGAQICAVHARRLTRWLQRGCVPVVAGFQGATAQGEVALLDRGGSDISSTALGYALHAERVDIFTDVPGIMTADPHLVPDAKLLKALTFEQALWLAQHGANVLHPEAVAWAKRGAFPIYVRSLGDLRRSSRLSHGLADAPTYDVPLGVACSMGAEPDSAVVALVCASAQGPASLVEAVRGTLQAARVPVTAIDTLPGAVTATVPGPHMGVAARLLHTHFLGGRGAVRPAGRETRDCEESYLVSAPPQERGDYAQCPRSL